jgi:hypothetical protein
MKGFLFVITVFLILTYILLSISVWVKSIESSERIFSEFYKESTVELAIEQITPEKVSNVSYQVMSRGLYRINELSSTNTVREGVDDELSNLESAMGELLVSGSADEDYFTYGDGLDEENSSMNAWVENLNASLLAIGIYIDDYEIYNFRVSQSDIDLVNYSFDMRLSMRDTGGKTSVSREYHIENNLSITGLLDPAMFRESSLRTDGDQEIRRAFFFEKDLYLTPGGIDIRDVSGTLEGGMGYFYGPLVHVDYAIDVAPTNRDRFILVGTFEEITDYHAWEDFGAYIVTSAPSRTPYECGEAGTRYHEDDTLNPILYTHPVTCSPELNCEAGACTVKPFIVAPAFRITDVPSNCPGLDFSDSSAKCALFINEYSVQEVLEVPSRKLGTSGSGIFDVEDLRDFVMCGYYTHTENSPSYLQRLLNNSYEREDTEFGIETFVIGQYSNDDAYDAYSRLDREMFTELAGRAVRGMPGCKQYEHCSDDPSTGIFRITSDSAPVYDADSIDCDEAEGCEE